jgi:transporter family-2 protein
MNQSLTLAFLVAAGIGLVVQNTLMVRITQSSSTILIAMLLNSLVGIVLFVSILLLKQGVAGFSELAATVRWWTLIPGCWGRFRVCQHQRLSERWRGDHHRRTGGKPADWRAGDGC